MRILLHKLFCGGKLNFSTLTVNYRWDADDPICGTENFIEGYCPKCSFYLRKKGRTIQ